jgi:sugar phosphate isomerase/epimerase
MTFQLGIMQGRLSDKPDRPLQSFPHGTWVAEFEIAKELGLTHVEWLLDDYMDEFNPLFTADGRKRIREIGGHTGVLPDSCCLHFLLQPEWKILSEAGKVNYLRRVFDLLCEIGCRSVCWPISSVVVEDIELASRMSERNSLKIFFEVNKNILEFRPYLKIFDPTFGIVFDTGNVWADSDDYYYELRQALPFVREIHIKDKERATKESKPLGFGDTPLIETFSCLRDAGWGGLVTLETPILFDYRVQIESNLAHLYSACRGAV